MAAIDLAQITRDIDQRRDVARRGFHGRRKSRAIKTSFDVIDGTLKR